MTRITIGNPRKLSYTPNKQQMIKKIHKHKFQPLLNLPHKIYAN